MLKYPEVIKETIIAAAFLSTQSPYLLPPGEEIDARRAHHRFRDEDGDFVSYLKLYQSYTQAPHKQNFCEKSYLDERALAEIVNVVSQLEEIVSFLKVPVLSGGRREDYLCAVAKGHIQFVCVRDGRELYRSLTADRILIHPGSVMFKLNPQIIVAGEIVRTTRMYAMSVSPLPHHILERIGAGLVSDLRPLSQRPEKGKKKKAFESEGTAEKRPVLKRVRDFSNNIKIGGEIFEIETVKGKKLVKLPWDKLKKAIVHLNPDNAAMYKGLRGIVILDGKYSLLAGEKLKLILTLAPSLEMERAPNRSWFQKERLNSSSNLDKLLEALPGLVKPVLWKKGKKELGFVSLFTDGNGDYWLKCSRGFHTSLNESLASVETLIDELDDDVDIGKKNIVNQTYRRLSDYLS